MIYSLVTGACGLLVPTPAVQQYVMPAAAAVQQSVSAQSLIFPTANLLAEGGTSIVTSFDDELDKMAIDPPSARGPLGWCARQI